MAMKPAKSRLGWLDNNMTAHEENLERISHALQSIGLPPVVVTERDRIEAAIIEASVLLEHGRLDLAKENLRAVLKDE